MFAFVVFLAAVASLHAAPKHIGETDLTTWPLSNNNTAYNKHDEGSYLSALEKASEKEASIHAKFKHTIALFNKIIKQLPVEKRENITNTLRYIFLKLKTFKNKSSAADDGDLEKSFGGKKPKELNINKSKSISNSTDLESRHPADHNTLNNNTDGYMLDVLSSKHLDAKTKQFLKDLLSANKSSTDSLISLPPIHPLMFEFDNQGVKREKIKKDEDESEEEYDNDNDKHQEVKTDLADRIDSNEDPISNFAQFPNGILFDDENEVPLQNNQNILPVSQVASANTWSHIQPEKIMHGNINPETAFNDLLASSTQMDENTNLFSELTDILGFSEEENEAAEKEQGGSGDLTKNTFSNQVMLSNAMEKSSDDNKNKDGSKELNENSVSEQFLHPNSIQKAIQNAIHFEDNHTRNPKRSQNVHLSSNIGSDRNLVHNLPKSKIPDTFLASSLQRIHTMDADSHFKEIPDPEKEIKALENLLKLVEGYSGPKHQHARSFQDQNNFFIPLDDDKMLLQYLQSDGGNAIKEDEQGSESVEENVLQTNVENRNGNLVLKGNSANGDDEEISSQSSSKNIIAALFPMEKQPEVSVINFSGSQTEQKKESSEEVLKEKPSIFRHDVLAQSRNFETKGNEVELNTENSKESEEAGTSVVLSGRQQGHHKVNSDVENIESAEAIRNLEQIPEHSWNKDSNSKTRESSESKESSGSANQRSENNEQKSSRGQDTVIDLKSSSKSESNEQDLSKTEVNIQDSSNSKSNEQDSSKSGSNEQDSRISGGNAIGSVNSKSNDHDSSNSGSEDSSISGSNEQDSNISGISEQDLRNSMSNEQDSSNSESNEQDSSNSESNEQDSSKSESNEQDLGNSGSIEQDSSDENQESKDSESQETRPVLFPPINHLDNIGDQLTRIDESKSESKIRKDVKPTNVIVRDHKPDVLRRQSYPQNDIPKDDLVFPIVQPKDDKRYVPNLPEDKRMLLDIPVDNPVRDINANWNFDEVNDDLNLVTPITSDNDLFIAIQNIERHLPKDMERNKRQNHYKKKTYYDYNGIIKLNSKYPNSKGIKHTRYSTKYNDPDFYNIKRTYGGIDNIKLTKYKKILPYMKNLYRSDVGYIEPEIYNRFLPYADDTDDYREGQIYKDSFGYQGPNSMYKKSTYSGHRLLKLTSNELYELNKIYTDSLGYQSSDSLYKKSTHSGHRLLKLTSKELDELNQIYRATSQYRPAPFSKYRNHHYPVFRSPHRILNEQMRINGDRSTDGIFYGGRSLFGRRLFGRIFNKEMTRPRHRAFTRQGFHEHSRTEHLSENRDYFNPDIYTRRHQ